MTKKLNHNLLHTIDELKKLPLLNEKQYELYQHRIEFLEQQLQDEELRITVVGEFSSGKSTFLNALIGQDLLPHAVRETTASVTYIKNVPTQHLLANKMEIRFVNKERPIDTLDIANNPYALRDYVTTLSDTFDVVKEVESVTIYVPFKNTDEPIVLIDTPGLNGIAEGHYEKTLQEIQQAHCSIFLFPIRGMSESNQQLFQLLTRYQQSFIFVLNFIDELKVHEGETPEGKVQEFKQDLLKYMEEEPTVFGISGLKALAAKDENIKRLFQTDTQDLTPERRTQLLKESRIEELETYLFKEVVEKQKQAIFERHVKHGLVALLEDLHTELVEYNRLYTASVDTSEKQVIEMRIKQAEERQKANWGKVANFIKSQQLDLRDLIKKSLSTDLQSLQQSIFKIIDGESLDSFENEIKNATYQKKLKIAISTLEQQYERKLRELIEGIYQASTLRIDTYHPNVKVSQKKKVEFQFKPEVQDFNLQEYLNDLEEVSNQRQSVEQDLRTTKQLKDSNQRELERKSEEDRQIRTESTRITGSYQSDKSRLGSRPAIREKRVERTRYESRRGLLGGLRTKVFGEKEISYMATIYDDNDQKTYDEKNLILDKQHDLDKQMIARKKRLIQDELTKLVKAAKQNASKEARLKLKLDELREEEIILRRQKEEIYEKSRNIYLRSEKNRFKTEITKLLEETLYHALYETIVKNIQENMKLVEREAERYYRQSSASYMSSLRILMEQMDDRVDVKKMKLVEQTAKTIEKLIITAG